VLWIDIDSKLRPGREEILEQRNRGNPIDTSFRNLRPRQLRNQAGPIGDSIEVIIVERYDHSVSGYVGISFDISKTEIDSLREGLQRVLGPISGAAPVCEWDWAHMVEIGVNWSSHGRTVDLHE
jgi:hypothetical protein